MQRAKTSRRVTLPQLLELRPELASSGKHPDRFVRQAVADRRLPYYNPTGGRLIFDLDEIDAWIESARVDPRRGPLATRSA